MGLGQRRFRGVAWEDWRKSLYEREGKREKLEVDDCSKMVLASTMGRGKKHDTTSYDVVTNFEKEGTYRVRRKWRSQWTPLHAAPPQVMSRFVYNSRSISLIYSIRFLCDGMVADHPGEGDACMSHVHQPTVGKQGCAEMKKPHIAKTAPSRLTTDAILKFPSPESDSLEHTYRTKRNARLPAHRAHIWR